MKLILELLKLREEQIELRPAEEVWKDSKDDVKTYVPSATYMARPIEDTDPVKYEVYQNVNDHLKLVGKFTQEDFDDSYVPVRPNQTADAEGYKLYRGIDEVEAFKYDGDTVRVDLEGETGKLNTGDYLIRQSEGDNFTYSIEDGQDFEADYSEKK